MSIVTLFGGSYCNADVIAEKVAQRLGCQCISEKEILAEASQRYDVAQDRLARALYGPAPFFRTLGENREQNVAYIRAVLADRICEENLVYPGFAVHLVPGNITHILRVCIVADKNYKIRTAIEREGIAEKRAEDNVRRDNEKQLEWVRYLHECGPWDEKLYDVVISVPDHSIEGALDLICENARKKVLAPTAPSRRAANDFMLAAQLHLLLAERRLALDISCVGGDVTLHINKLVVRLEHVKKELAAIVSSVPGVKRVEARTGHKYKRPQLHRDLDFELPSKILLVDDEREFVETLSERLQAREMASSVAYNGEEALSQVEQDEPEVMVLDLKMPGIDGMEVLRKMRKERPNVVVIILTGHGSEVDRTQAEELGAFAYLEKPVDIDVLTQTMKEAYQHAREARAAGDKSDTPIE
jgi:two-component system, OmpR family, response regulator CpxR